MMQTNCKKCGAELFLRDGYCVCNNCGEIYALVEEEEIEEVLGEEKEETSQIIDTDIIKPVIEETPVVEEVFEEPEEEEQEVETEQTEEEKVIPAVENVEKKKSKFSAVIWTVVVLICAVLVCFAGKFYLGLQKNGDKEVSKQDYYAVEETDTEEESKAEEEKLPEEEKEVVLQEEPKEESIPPVKSEVQEKKPVKTEKPVVSETPAIAYRIRKSADDSDTQIGAFSDIERAKAFAASHAADGYKVFDMEGNLVYQP